MTWPYRGAPRLEPWTEPKPAPPALKDEGDGRWSYGDLQLRAARIRGELYLTDDRGRAYRIYGRSAIRMSEDEYWEIVDAHKK